MGLSKDRRVAQRSHYFVLYMDASDESGEAIDSYDLGSVSQSRLRKGVPFPISELPSIRFKLSDGKPTDCLGGPISWMIVSTRCANCLTSLVAAHVQFLPIQVELPDGSCDKSRYQIANPLGSVDAIFSPKTPKQAVAIHELVLDRAKIPPDVNMFRLTHNLGMIVVTAAVIQSIQDNNLVGFAASPVETVDSLSVH